MGAYIGPPTGYVRRAGDTMTGNLGMGAGLTVDGVDVSEIKLGTWLSRTVNTVYQASTDGVVVSVTTNAAAAKISGFTDGSNPPTVLRTAGGYSPSDGPDGLCMPVKKDDYWKVTGNVAGLWWIPTRGA